MRSISVREFQQNFHNELKDLPFVVTRNGKESFIVTTSEAKKELKKGKSPVVTSSGMFVPKSKDKDILFE